MSERPPGASEASAPTERSEASLVAAPSATVGPFFHLGLTTDRSLGVLADGTAHGERITLKITVTDGDGVPVPDALVEIWQVDADGNVAEPPDSDERPDFSGFGRLPTGDDGSCAFETVLPGRASDGAGGLQAPHINVCLFARGLLRHVCTRLYFAGDPTLAEDAALALVPDDRRHTLLAAPDAHDPGRWVFAIRLQGDDETVFFDV
jgi:protocatechuate 3,4-dioxygenase alpha subunit